MFVSNTGPEITAVINEIMLASFSISSPFVNAFNASKVTAVQQKAVLACCPDVRVPPNQLTERFWVSWVRVARRDCGTGCVISGCVCVMVSAGWSQSVGTVRSGFR